MFYNYITVITWQTQELEQATADLIAFLDCCYAQELTAEELLEINSMEL